MPTIQAIAPFTHEGREYDKGEQLHVSDSAATWLVAQKVAEVIREKPKSPQKHLADEEK